MKENIWPLYEDEEDDDLMQTVTLLHAVKRHKNIRKHRFWIYRILGRENNLAHIII